MIEKLISNNKAETINTRIEIFANMVNAENTGPGAINTKEKDDP